MVTMRQLQHLGRLKRVRKLAALMIMSGLALGFFQLLGTSVILDNAHTQDELKILQDGLSFGRNGPLSLSQAVKNVHSMGERDVGATPSVMKQVDQAGSAPSPATSVQSPTASTEDSQEPENSFLTDMVAMPGLGPSPGIAQALSSALVIGPPKENITKRFLTVGIPTVKREKATYIYETLDSLFAAIASKDQDNIILLVFTADMDPSYNKEVAEKLAKKYPQKIDRGILQVIANNASMYPNLFPSRRTFNDSRDRVFWRCKQNIDTAFLFMYAASLSTYYIHLEDDVITAKNFFVDIKRFLGIQRKPWVMLEFGRLGFIGKMFHSKDLPKLASCLLVFYQEQPVDLLVPYFIKIMTQVKRTYAPYSLFQHIGLHSSLKNKKQALVDKRFKKTLNKRVTRTYKVANPDATISSNMEPYQDSRAADAYGSKGYVFWAANIKHKDFYKVVFTDPQNVTAVVVVTGAVFAQADRLYNASLRYGVTPEQCQDNGDRLTVARPFAKGRVFWIPPQPLTLTCVDVWVEANQKFWALFSEVAIFTGNATLPSFHMVARSVEDSVTNEHSVKVLTSSIFQSSPPSLQDAIHTQPHSS